MVIGLLVVGVLVNLVTEGDEAFDDMLSIFATVGVVTVGNLIETKGDFCTDGESEFNFSFSLEAYFKNIIIFYFLSFLKDILVKIILTRIKIRRF